MEHPQGEAIQLLHDAKPARDYILFHLYATHKRRGLLTTDARVEDKEFEAGKAYRHPHSDYQTFGWVCGLLLKYMLTTGDLAILKEKIAGGIMVLERLEEALEANWNIETKKQDCILLKANCKIRIGLGV